VDEALKMPCELRAIEMIMFNIYQDHNISPFKPEPGQWQNAYKIRHVSSSMRKLQLINVHQITGFT